ncbi:hypothetical protein A6A04_06085 [Paramagnetospirillum marisnigri]|uniref:Alkaline phosphatase n=1 Tax=Paramagnetospirillum marisnigri TaxID=1285242 RepID=A0A178MCZ0_9PROT|nr:alkaline phosphatase PhoX [Paramagnetospirillum marisnigri]OAN46671.1 hypothetical protein A6A04_06085 [Paramagnetospirillum marisnigri]
MSASRIAAAALALCLPVAAHAAAAKVVSVGFTETPAPSSDADMLRTYTTSKAVVTYADGSKVDYPLSYNVLFRNIDKVGAAPHEAGRLFDMDGKPLVDPNGDAVIAETPDANSLLKVGNRLFLVTHWEYDWLLGNGQDTEKAPGWHARMPMGMTLTDIAQDKASGALKATGQRSIDFAPVGGLWIPCFGSQTPWNTHLGSEEDYDLYFLPASGDKLNRKATDGLKALSEVYFKGRKQANPYDYGYLVEVKVKPDGSTAVTKHYAMGRATWEMGKVMPDGRTVYKGDDGDHTYLSMFIADKAGDLSAGTHYAARWIQESAEGGGKARLQWIRLGHATNAQAKALLKKGVTADAIFDFTTTDKTPDWQAQGFHQIMAGHGGIEVLRVRKGMEQAAVIFEPRRLAAIRGATTEFNKMEGVAVDTRDRQLYIAMSYIEKGMTAEPGAPADHIQVGKVTAGGTYQVALSAKQKDERGRAIDSAWVGTVMHVPPALLGEDIKADAKGNVAHVDKVANTDNVFFSDRMRTLFIGEDSGTHVNNFLWAYNVDTKTLTRIMTSASGAENTGLQVVDNLNGHGYIMANAQHQGEWIKTMPKEVKERLAAKARELHGVNAKGALNYQQIAPVGYLGGLPGL